MTEKKSKERIGEWAARWADIKYTFYLMRKNRLVMIGSIIALFFVFLSLFSKYIVDPKLAGPLGYPDQQYPYPDKLKWDSKSIINWGPGIALYYGPEVILLGTDNWGRDLLKMIILAIPVDMGNAIVITLGAAAFGTLVGAFAGYIGGIADEAILRITDIFLAFPALLLALVFASIMGRTMGTLRLALLLVWWPPYVRLMRGQILSEKQKGYVEALKALGVGHFRTLFVHIIPNSIYPILVQATLDFGGVILTFSALMFLGFSPTPSLPELGNLAAAGYQHIFEAPWLIVFPGLTMLIIALAFNLVGDGLRDVLDPKLRR
ncbi:MAG: ABC transporter permease [Candidatus Bathyarchaeota archaeon]|jgi:peptide/nickel transport system permease protein